MGLDMYLCVQIHNMDREFDSDTPQLSKTIYETGYWRKANAIHQFFVDGYAGGKDDCSPIYLGEEALLHLKTKCQRVLACAGTSVFENMAKRELPTGEGFFFGSTMYDEGYIYDLKKTVKIINNTLKFIESKNNDPSKPCMDIYYQASW